MMLVRISLATIINILFSMVEPLLLEMSNFLCVHLQLFQFFSILRPLLMILRFSLFFFQGVEFSELSSQCLYVVTLYTHFI